MRAPTLNGPSVASTGLPGYQQQEVRTDTSIARGIGELGAGVQQLGEGIDREVKRKEAATEKARQEAEALAENNALLEQHRLAQAKLMGDSSESGRIEDAFSGTDTSKGGFLATRGVAASASSAETLNKLREDRQTIAATLTPASRQRFLSRSAESLLAYSKQVEGHVQKEFNTARESSAKGSEQLAIGMAAAGVPDFDVWLTTTKQAKQSLMEMAPSREAGAAAVADFESRNSSAFVSGLLAQGKADEAKAFVTESRAQLGARYPEAQANVDRANAGAEKDRLIAEGAKLVDGTYDSLRMEGESQKELYVDPEKLRDAIKLDESDPGVRGEISVALERRIHEEDARKKRDIGTNRDDANRADVQRRPIPGGTINFLEKYDPDFLLAREARLRADARAAKALRSGDARDRAAAKAQQTAWDLQYRYRLEARLAEDPATKPSDVLVELVAERAKEGEDMTVSQTELERGGARSAKTVKQAGTTMEAAKKKFTDEFGATLKAKMKPSGKGAKVDDELLQQRKGKAAAEYSDWVEANGGKPLDAQAAAELKARQLKDAVIEEAKPRTVMGIAIPFTGTPEKRGLGVDLVKPRPAVPTSAQKPPAGSVTLRRKSDGKSRVVSATEAARFLSDPNFEQVP